MPYTEVVIYKELNNRVPVVEWVNRLSRKIKKKLTQRIESLELHGRDLRRPIVAHLRDGIWEIRAEQGNVNYRILYSFVGQDIILLTNGCTKEKRVPEKEINKAVKYKRNYLNNPEAHTHTETENE